MGSQSPRDASASGDVALLEQPVSPARRRSASQNSKASDGSHTAIDFIRSQLQLEADAREVLPYSIEHCTKPLGRLRQAVFACLTCNPAPSRSTVSSSVERFSNAAGICYACSVQCHGEHDLVELFNKRQFTCDCGTTRFPISSPCCLRLDPNTNTKGVHSEMPDKSNKYNHNFYNRFCGCGLEYDPFHQEGTMFQCLGLGTHETGGCGEDWWHPGCVVGMEPDWFKKGKNKGKVEYLPGFGHKLEEGAVVKVPDALPSITEDTEEQAHGNVVGGGSQIADDADRAEEEEPPLPPGFPKEDDFEGFICYKCVEANPWIRQYAGAPGFLPAVPYHGKRDLMPASAMEKTEMVLTKRKAAEDAKIDIKRARSYDHIHEENGSSLAPNVKSTAASVSGALLVKGCKRETLPPPPVGKFSLFFTEGFRENLCRCSDCFPLLVPHPQLLEPEETYEPPVSEEGQSDDEGGGTGNGSHGSGSLYERGESALRNVDRVRAIEGVMAYNHLKDRLKPFFQQFAESGKAISAEDIKEYFAKLRGDEQAIREANDAAKSDDNRREQSGY